MSTTDAANQMHADGKTLLAVAEGDAEQQPGEAMLSHIFSCSQCSESLHEMRQSLSILASGSAGGGTSTRAALRPAHRPGLASGRRTAAGTTGEKTQLAAAEALETDPMLDLAESESYDAEKRARGMIWKLAIVGALLTVGMMWLKSTAASM